ncbi:S8 family serine peptidase [Rhizocola hellebori]|uniref:S8 family serine peptidase n=1 Tax=Rhizocola hellebori TaxID=1392758 RepID=UPI0019427A2D|nr:S8 family serine peptidase [Rhizocola hellebori]
MTVNSAAHAADQKIGPVAREEAGRTASSRIARTDRALLGRNDTEPIPVLVKLDHDPVASYRGGISGYAATSPALTGRRLTGSDADELAYAKYLEQRETRFTDQLTQRLPQVKVRQRLRTVYGGMALTVPANRVKDLLTLDSVVAVQKDELRQPLTDSSSQFIGADRVQQDLGGARRAGKGVLVGILDTGAWPEHPSFADQGVLGTPPTLSRRRPCDFGEGFTCNNKLISGQAFLDSYLTVHETETYTTARDSDGHGTHTASTTAGNVLESAKVFGVERGPIRGVAPGAWLAVYKVCGAEGCMSSDSAAAISQAIYDGVDVVNYSISGGTDPFTDPVEMAFLDAYAAGVFVAASAGNSGPGEGTVNHLSPWVTTVAASTQTRAFEATLTFSNGQKLTGASITAGVGPAPVVRNGKCLEPAKAGAFLGKIVVCERGGNARVDKGWNVKRGGAVGMILFNPTLQDVETDNHWLPAVHLPDNAIVSILDSAPDLTATISAGVKAKGRGDVIAGFSSRGPGGLALKPDVTAPGVQILAGHTPKPTETAGGPPGELFQAIAGTSMSSPHVAGAAALLAAKRPEWTPGQLKSALMTTALTDVVKEDLTTPADPFDFGAGRIAVDKAAQPGLTIAETAERMLRYADDEVNAINLNLPSVNAPIMPGRLRTTRVVRNDTNQLLTYHLKSADDAVTVSPAVVTVAAGKTASIQITISSLANDAKWRFGSVTLTPVLGGYPTLHLPVAYRPSQGLVTLTSKCTAERVEIGDSTECRVKVANTGYEDASVSVSTETGPELRLASGAIRKADLAGVVPGIPALSKVEDRRFKRLAVDADPIGDEEILTYDVPSFTYAGQSYQRIGVVSNGYLVIGTATSQDIRFEPPTEVTKDRPNNVLAPYWADLDGTGADGIRVATVQSEGKTWIVVEWQVNLYGTDQTQVFQAWLATGAQESVRFAYDADALPNGAKTFAVGAENALGKGELVSVAPSNDVAVASSGGRPGGMLDFSVTVTGVLPAAHAAVTTSMRSDGVPGTTLKQVKFGVDAPR